VQVALIKSINIGEIANCNYSISVVIYRQLKGEAIARKGVYNMEITRNLYKVTHTDYTDSKTDVFNVVAANEEMAAHYCKLWRDMFTTVEVELLKIDVVAPFGVRQAFWNV